MFKKYQGKLLCFSPPVMLATFIIEFSLAIYTFWRYKINTITKLSIIMLISLGTFQLAEYMICGGIGLSNTQWAKIGYGAITLLPALGIHMLVAISGKKIPALITTAYTSCASFFLFYIFVTNSVNINQCYPNYAVFSAFKSISIPFGIYYYGWLIIGVALAWLWSNELPKHKKALQSMVIGYLVFLLPTTTINVIDPNTIKGIPSIMCGFAVLYAVILVVKVLPNSRIEFREKANNFIESIYVKG
ncbi:MAG TPA: hypothetical protein PLO25_02340 [Candidatus Saccharibacteria bacterium]|nr:hypothetical protein [Candidatus Saccharibacteria bacterium]